MPERERKTLEEVVAEVGKYTPEAYVLIKEGLDFAVERIHGPLTDEQRVVARYMSEQQIDLAEVINRFDSGLLDPEVSAAVESADGHNKLNRHIGGENLCWALRDYALNRWGLLARAVLARWGIGETLDFGRIVFALVDNDFLQKEPNDHLNDFRNVYDFREALDGCFRFNMPQGSSPERCEP